jgi:hypothetical protein
MDTILRNITPSMTRGENLDDAARGPELEPGGCSRSYRSTMRDVRGFVMPVISLPCTYLAKLDEMTRGAASNPYMGVYATFLCLSRSESCGASGSRSFTRWASISTSAVTPMISWSLCYICLPEPCRPHTPAQDYIGPASRRNPHVKLAVCTPLDGPSSSSLLLPLCYGYTSGSSQSPKCPVPSPYHREGQRRKDIYPTESM